MSDSEDFPTDSEQSMSPSRPQPPVSILRHLPAPLRLLPLEHSSYELYSPRCLFSQPLPLTKPHSMPRIDNVGKKSNHNRLLALEDAFFLRGQVSNGEKQSGSDPKQGISLWENYKEAQMVYSRFGGCPQKDHFAGILMSVGGVFLDKKKCSLPLLKASLRNNSGASLIFDSHFENGNLMWAYRNSKGPNDIQTYDLILQNDLNTRGHNQWFSFRATSTVKHQKVRFNICNLVKGESLFSYGLKPLVFSQKENSRGLGWHRGGHRIHYKQNSMVSEHSGLPYSTLSFEYEFREAFDSVQFCPSYPYTYSQLLQFMDSLLKNQQYQPYLSIKKLCETPAKNTVNLISISTGRRAIQDTKVVWILARQHPVETTSSFMVEGIVSYILKTISEAQGAEADFYDGYTFKIVPMVNPDGVIHGNSRAQITGVDPNRVWKKPSKTVTPAVYHIKRQILETRNNNALILDLHSHSTKLGCFFYGNHTSGNAASHRVLPSTVCQNDPRFCYNNCRFRGGHQGSARRVLYSELGIPNIFTVQCSLLGFVKDNRISEYDISDYLEMGAKVVSTFMALEREQQLIRAETYPHYLTDCCDAQSARSDSCVSLYEFPEAYKCLRGKRKMQQKRKKPVKSSTQVQAHKSHKSELSKQPHRSLVREVLRSEATIKQKDRSLERPPLVRENQSLEEEAPFVNSKYNSRRARLLAKKRAPRTILAEPSLEASSFCHRDSQEQSVQVNQLQALKANNTFTRTKNRKLMVLGSGLQEERLLLSKNDVGVQINTFKENSLGQTPFSGHSGNKAKLGRQLGRRETQGPQGKEEAQPSRIAKLFRV